MTLSGFPLSRPSLSISASFSALMVALSAAEMLDLDRWVRTALVKAIIVFLASSIEICVPTASVNRAWK